MTAPYSPRWNRPQRKLPLQATKVRLARNGTRIERSVIDHIATHPAAKATFRALVGTLVAAFIKSHGEITGWAEIIQAASRPHDSNRNGSGVLSARFDVMGCVGWNGPAIRATSQSGSLREQATLFTNLLLSNNFKEIVQLALTDTDLQVKLSDLI